MDSFQDIFDKIDYKKNNNVKETNKTDKILTALYESISKINSRVKNISEINSSNIVLENIQDNALLKKQFQDRLSTYGSSFFDDKIRNYISSNTKSKLSYSYNDSQYKITISFYLMKDDVSNDEFISNVEEYFHVMLTWLIICSKISDKGCMSKKKMTIDIFLSPFKKELPSNDIDLLEPFNINTGFTARCGGDKNGVVIYRKEEWFKVFLHETMHYFAFDENLDNNDLIDEISDFFLLKKKIKVYEAYCEFWSRIMNSVFIAFMLCNGNDNGNDNDKDNNYFLKKCYELLEYERTFSSFQSAKMINRHNICYNSIKDKKSNPNISNFLYKERTNVFAYYIITNILMNNYEKYVNYCLDNNSSLFLHNKNANLLGHYIKKNYNKNMLIYNLELSLKVLDDCIKQNNQFGIMSCRMSIADLQNIKQV